MGGSQPNVRTLGVENFWLALIQHHFIVAPPATLKEETVDIGTILRLQIRRFLHELKVVGDLVNGDGVSPCEVLKHTGEETLREEKSRDPEDSWIPDIYPSLEERKPGLQIGHIRAKWFQGGIGLAHPKIRYFSVEERLGGGLKRSVHDDLTHHCKFDVLERGAYNFDEAIESLQLLGQYSVHGLVVGNWVHLHHFCNVVHIREITQNSLDELLEYLLE